MEIDLDKRYQTLMVLWGAQLMSIGLFFLIAVFAAPVVNRESSSSPTSLITYVLAALGAFLVVISFVVKRKLLERSVDQQDVNLVQKGFIIAWAMCEVCALIGLIERFMLGNWDYFLLFVIAAHGIALQFPRREHLKSASFETTSSGAAGS